MLFLLPPQPRNNHTFQIQKSKQKDWLEIYDSDFIFEGSIGRCDLEGGDFDLMLKSIELIKTYDSNIILYPGHGNSTTLENEIKNNIYFKGDLYE